jgi:hypothetical protein
LRNKIKPSSALINPDAERIIAEAKGYIDSKGQITPRTLAILEEFDTYLVKTKAKVAKEVLGDDFMEKLQTYLDMFPKKRLPSGLYARQSIKELKDKFVWFFKTYPEYTWDMVLDATDYYIYLKEHQDVPYKFMMTSSYFIKKSDPYTKEIKSALADTCQELLDNPDLT